MVLAGVAFGITIIGLDPIARVNPISSSMSAGAALSFLLLGMLLHLSVTPTADSPGAPTASRDRLRVALSSAVTLLGLASMLSYLTTSKVDALVARDLQNAAAMPAPMSLTCAVAVAALGMVFLLRQLRWVAALREWFALAGFALGYLALMGYVYGAEPLYRIGASAIPVPSAVCVILIASGCLLLPPYDGVMRPIVSKGPGGMLVRRLLPVALFVAPAVDLAQTKIADYLGDSSLALVGLANVVLLVVLIWSTGKVVHVADSKRRLAEASVAATHERLVLALQAAEGGAWDLNLERNDAWWSPEMYRLWRVPPGQPILLHDSLEQIDPRDRSQVLRAVDEAIVRRLPYECEFRLKRDGDNERWMASRGRIHYDSTGKAMRLIGITVDISSRKAAEIRLWETNEALARTNVELQRFAHIAAHDLQTPLRGIGNFAELLQTCYHARLDDQGRGWLDRILSSVGRLHALIRDLLEYSSIDTQPLLAQRVSLNETLDRALSLLDVQIHECRAVITRDPLPTVNGEFTQLMQVMLNLVGNSLKYRCQRAPAIHISAEQLAGAWRICVQDNGIGIDPRHAVRIFEMFERLHTAQEYPGTGIGLALCRRVIQRHGGTIWVESEFGIGSKLFFTLPIAAA